jgi:hypothetical protein
MKRITGLLICITSLISGCGNQGKVELKKYINQDLPVLGKKESAIVSDYNALKRNAKALGDEKVFELLTENIIPACIKLLEDVSKLAPSDKDLRATHEIFIKMTNLQCAGYILIADSLDKQDLSVLLSGNEKMNEASRLSREFKAQLDEQAKKNGLQFSKQRGSN